MLRAIRYFCLVSKEDKTDKNYDRGFDPPIAAE